MKEGERALHVGLCPVVGWMELRNCVRGVRGCRLQVEAFRAFWNG